MRERETLGTVVTLPIYNKDNQDPDTTFKGCLQTLFLPETVEMNCAKCLHNSVTPTQMWLTHPSEFTLQPISFCHALCLSIGEDETNLPNRVFTYSATFATLHFDRRRPTRDACHELLRCVKLRLRVCGQKIPVHSTLIHSSNCSHSRTSYWL
jgi:hypothetical protein